MSFFQFLHETRKSIDPRDIVYGLAALVNSTSRYHNEIDYSKAVAQVYTEHAVTEVASSMWLNTLTRVRLGRTNCDAPSWVLNSNFTGTPSFTCYSSCNNMSHFMYS
jgi:hypothetical protein